MAIRSKFYEESPINSEHGLYIFKDVITAEEEQNLLELIDSLESGDSKRNYVRTRTTLHFGHVFNPATLKVDPSDSTIEIPKDISNVIDSIFRQTHIGNANDSLSDFDYDQITINRYVGGTKCGIGSHVDTHSTFTDKIISLSLGAPTVMRFELPKITDDNSEFVEAMGLEYYESLPKSVDIWVEPRTLMVMSGMSRYLYKHKISIRKTDIDPDGDIIKRRTRTSITIRKANFTGTCDCEYPMMCDYQNPSSLVLPDRMKTDSNNRPILEPQIDIVETESTPIKVNEVDPNKIRLSKPKIGKDKSVVVNIRMSEQMGLVPNDNDNSFRTVDLTTPFVFETPFVRMGMNQTQHHSQ